MMPWIFLFVSVVGLVFTLNAFLPVQGQGFLAKLFIPSFFASWLTIELAGHHLAWQAAAVAVLVSLGGLEGAPGWAALAITFVSWAGLLVLLLQGRRSGHTIAAALSKLAAVEPGPRVPWWHVLLPLPLRFAGIERVLDVEFARYGKKRLTLDVFLPKEQGTRRPAVLQIHGGAWVLGDKRHQGLPLLTHLARAGWVGFNVNYRLSPRATFPDHLVDLKKALAWIREHADEYGVDPDFVAVTGGSAGGHLAALMALTANDPRYQPGFEAADTSVQAAVPFYGVYDFTNRLGSHHPEFQTRLLEPLVMKASLEEAPELYREASPLDRVRPDAPPFLVVHGDRDTLAPLADARLFVERLSEVSRQPVVYFELMGAQHAFDVFPSPRSVPVVEGVERFLRAVYRERSPREQARAREAVADVAPVDAARAAGS